MEPRWSRDKILASHANSPRFNSWLGRAGMQTLYVIYKRSATSVGCDIKPRSSLCTHAFKFMHGLKRTWMTKQKSRGPETDRLCRHAKTPHRRNVAAYRQANWKRSHTCFLLGTGRTLQASKQDCPKSKVLAIMLDCTKP